MKLKTKIEQILTKNIEVRDNPKKLIRKVLQEVYGINILSAIVISEHYKQIESIMRANRKAQSDNEELRGKTWRYRKEVLAPIAKKELGY